MINRQKNKFYLKIILTLVIIFSLIFSQEKKFFWDGKTWNSINEKQLSSEIIFELKKSYINGIQDGRLYDYFKLWSIDSSIVNNNLKPELDDYLSSTELVRLIDDFYVDPINSYLPVISSILILNMKARGRSKSEINKYIKKSKDWINSLVLEIENEDYYFDKLKK